MSRTRQLYNPRRYSRRGFVIAPLLYALGLIGVVGGTLFSNNMQVLKSNITVQNGLTVRSDLQAATNTLSAEAVLGTDGQTLCPPRSTHEPNGGICAAAPVALIQFSDLAAATTRLPANYANAASSGSPIEVGVFAAGAGVKQLDPYGRYYVYCRWENTRSNPAASTFVILTAGPDGTLQSNCGSTAAQGDDTFTLLTIGEAINRASLWQSGASNSVSYGASGSQITVDAGGNISATSLTTTGNVNVGGSETVTGNTTLAALSASTGDFSGGLNVAGQINAPYIVSSSGGVFGPTTISSLSVTGMASIGSTLAVSDSLHVANQVTASQLMTNSLSSGTITAGSSSLGTASATTLNVSGAASIGGMLTGTAANFSGAVTGSAGSFVSLAVSGASSLSGNVEIGGTLSGENAIFNGTVAAANFTNAGTLTTGSLSGGAGRFSSLNVSGGTTLSGGLTASGIMDMGNLSVAGATALAGLSATTGSFSGNLSASSFSLVGDESMYGHLGVGCDANSNVPLVVCENADTGPIAFFEQTANVDSMIGISAPTGYGTQFGFDEGTTDYWGIGKYGAEQGRGFYLYDYTSGEDVLEVDYPSGDLHLGESSDNYLTILANGNAGFGTTEPINSLDVAGATVIGYDYAGMETAPANGLLVEGNVGIGTTSTGGANGILALSYNGNTDNMLVFTNTYTGGRTWGLGDDTGNTCSSGQFCIYDFTAGATRLMIAPSGNVGIGTTNPAATLDINGYLHLKKNSSAPATCSASTDGDIALTHVYTLCVCKSGTGWVTASTGSTSCTW